jgi:hypothetical protein
VDLLKVAARLAGKRYPALLLVELMWKLSPSELAAFTIRRSAGNLIGKEKR